MSSQKGNQVRTRPQKYKNRTAFKNTLHDKSHKTKMINSIHVSDVCVRCKDIIEWKIKYKKYKPLSQPRTCVKCDQKTVKKAYHVMCLECGRKLGLCTKCCQSKEVVQAATSEQDQLRMDSEMKLLLESLPERKKRTFIRYMNKMGTVDENGEVTTEETKKDDLMSKLNALKVAEDGDEDDDYGFDDFSDSD